MTAAERALELLADTVELPGLTIVRSGRPVARDDLRGNAELLELLTRYRAVLRDLVGEAMCVTCGAVGEDLVAGVAPGTLVCVDSEACEDRFTERGQR